MNRTVLALAAVLLLCPTTAGAAGVQARFDIDSPSDAPFPSDRFTVLDDRQLTGLRINLLNPDCALAPQECDDVEVLNALDGFSLLPRLSIPLSGAIDPSTFSSETVFLIALGEGPTAPIGIERRVWDATANTLHAEPAALLAQHARYLLIATDGLRDPSGAPVQPSSAFLRLRRDDPRATQGGAYWRALRRALDETSWGGVAREHVVAASLFTTLSTTATYEHLRDEIKAEPAPPAPDFNLGPGGARTVFRLDQVTAVMWLRQVGVETFSPSPGTPPLDVVKTAAPEVGTLAFGRFGSIHYLGPDGLLANPVSTGGGPPAGVGASTIYFNLFVPAGSKPAAGWPVVLSLHGGGNTNMGSPWRVSDRYASLGVATIAINGMGAGFGPLGTLTVTRTVENGGPVTFPMGGRAIDSNGDGVFEAGEGGESTGIAGSRDATIQDIADYMRLIRVIERGIDVDGDGTNDLDPSKIFCYGHSRGGRQGIALTVIDPSVRALAAEAPGMSYPMDTLPLRGEPPVTIDAARNEIQEQGYQVAWAQMQGGSLAGAPHLRREPLDGVPPGRVLIVFARADRTVWNPLTSALLRAGDLADRTLFFRSDLFIAATGLPPLDPHSFVAFGNNTLAPPVVRVLARATQESIATFFRWDGTGVEVPLPIGHEAFFEAPIVPPLPEDLGFVP